MFGSTSFSFGNTSNAFGNNNNNKSMFGNNNTSAFGSSGFGNSSNTAFGNSGFGNNNSSAFGSGSGFGSSTFGNSSGFGNNNNGTSAFGRSSFGSSSAFGRSNNTSSFGAFGSTSNNTSAFGSSTLFGNNNSSSFGNTGFGNSNSSVFGKTGFGNNTSSFGSGMSTFGSNNNNTSAFGGGMNTFGSNNNSSFGGFGSNSMNSNNGTGNPKFQQQIEKDDNSYHSITFNSISAMPAYRNFSFEELRVKDYMMGKKGPSMGMGNNSLFGTSTSSFGGMNNNNNNTFGNNTSAFGGGGFGSSMNNNNTFGGSAFGNNNQNSSFGGFGNSNNNNSNNSFGFGNNNNNNNNNTFGNSGFGSTGFGMNNNNNTTGGSVFGQSAFGTSGFNKPSTGIFGSSNTNSFGSTGFGTNNNNNNNAFGSSGFGNQSSGFGNSSGFGSNTNNNNTFGSSGFGQNNNTSAFSSGFKFGSNNNSTSTGLFGQNNNTMGNQTSLFGNNSNNNGSTGLFGQNNSTNNTSSTSLFGNTNTNNTNSNTSGFGFKSSSGFGTTNTSLTNSTGTTGVFGTSNSLFNKTGFSTAATASSSAVSTTSTTFGFSNTTTTKSTTSVITSFNNTNTSAKPTVGFGATTNTTLTTMPNNMMTTAVVPSVKSASIKQTIEKININKSEPQITPIIEKNKIATKKVTPKIVVKKINSRIKIREYNNEIQETNSELSENEQSKDRNMNSKKKNNKICKDIQKLLDEYEREQKENKIKEDIAINEIKDKTVKLRIKGKEKNQKLNIPETIQIQKLVEEPEEINDEENELSKEKNNEKEITQESNNVENNLIKKEIEKEVLSIKDTIIKSRVSKRLSINNQYEVNPPISKLIQMTDEELSKVKDLEVYVKNIGSLKFLEPVDLLSACNGKKRENIPYIFGNIIIIQSKSCTVYPDDRFKPEVGQGLNHPAIIELYNCWVKDKSTGKPVLDPSHPAYKRHLSTLKKIKDTEFINYEALQGKWTFKVEHFTRYGLFTDEDDDEDEYFDELIINNRKELKINRKINGKINGGYGLISTDEESSENDANNFNSVINQQNNKEVIISEVLSEDDIKQKNKLDSMKYCFNSMENAKKLQVMNVSIFGTNNNSSKHSTLKTINYSENLIPITKSRMERKLEKLNSLRNNNNNVNTKSTPKINIQILKQFKKNFEENKKLIITSINNGAPVLSLKSNLKNHTNKLEKEISTLSNISTEDLDKLDIVQNNLENVPLYQNSIFNKDKDFNLLMSRSFRVGWGQNNLIAIPSISSFNSTLQEKIRLGIVNTCKILFEDEKEKHIPLLTALLQSSKIRHDFNNELNKKEISNDIKKAKQVITNPVVVKEHSNKSFTILLNTIKPAINTTFYKTEILMYKLCQILFDNNDISELEECEDLLSEKQKQYIITMQKKQNIGKWLKNSLIDSVKTTIDELKKQLDELKVSDTSGDSELKKTLISKLIFINLSGGMTINACKEAMNNGELRLATLISQLSSCNENISEKKTISRGVPGSGKTDTGYMDMIKHQIEIWEKEGGENNINNVYKDIFKLLSGQVDYTLCKDLINWKQVLGLIFWYKDGGSLSFPEALNHFDLLMQEIKINISQNSMNVNLFNYTDDIIYYLFKFYANNDFSRSKILLPKNSSNSNLDYRISWVLNQLLPPTNNLSYIEKEKLDDKLTHSYVFQLESIGLWEWACFVAMHLQNPIEREKIVRRILIQYFPLDSNDDSIYTVFSSYLSNWNFEVNSNNISSNISKDQINNKNGFLFNPNKNYTNLWHFLVDKLQIPKLWIHDAKRIKAIYQDDILREVFYTMDCEQWKKAHELIMEKLASDLIIHRKYEILYELLKILSQKLEIEDNNEYWDLNGGLYLDFINFNENFSSLLETHKSIFKNLQQYQNEKSNLMDRQSQNNTSSEQVNSLFSINADYINQSTIIFNKSYHEMHSSIIEINQYLEKISTLLNRITKKKKELIANEVEINNKNKLQGLEVMEEILMTAYYACNDAKNEQKKYINSFEKGLINEKEKKGKEQINDDEFNDEFEEEDKDEKEEINDDAIVPEISNPILNYQLLSDTSLNENKRLLLIDQLTDKWFNTVLDL